MKRTRYLHLVALVLAPALFAQEPTVSIGAHGLWLAPVGPLANRFRPTTGGSVDFRLKRDNPQWGGSVEYFKFDKEATDKLFITRTVRDSSKQAEGTFNIPLSRLTMSLEVVGASANISYDIWYTEVLETRITAGFGIYRWKGTRSGYYDTLRAQLGDSLLIAEILRVPPLEQVDWSGGFNLGADIDLRIYGPVWFAVGGRFRLVVGELWPTLALDLENVSTFQILEVRAGIRVLL